MVESETQTLLHRHSYTSLAQFALYISTQVATSIIIIDHCDDRYMYIRTPEKQAYGECTERILTRYIHRTGMCVGHSENHAVVYSYSELSHGTVCATLFSCTWTITNILCIYTCDTHRKACRDRLPRSAELAYTTMDTPPIKLTRMRKYKVAARARRLQSMRHVWD